MPAIKKARKTLEQLSADEGARELARARDKGRRDFNSEIYYAKTEGRAEGRAEGIGG